MSREHPHPDALGSTGAGPSRNGCSGDAAGPPASRPGTSRLPRTAEQAGVGRSADRGGVAADVPVLDPRALLDTCSGDHELMREVTALFVDGCPRRLASLGRALAQQDGQALRQLAHALKGAAAQVGARRIAAVAAELEGYARGGDWPGADTVRAMLEAEFLQLRQALTILV
jgi:HPt (histidine-containing phosphotransfer) domain-containing protein